MGPFDDFTKALREEMKRSVPVQTVWATVETVSDTTMTVADADESAVKYYNVLLGLQGMIIEPVVGSKVLIGVIENKATACFLIHADQWKSCRMNGEKNGGMAIAPNIASRLKEHETKVNALIDYISQLPVAVSGAVGAPPVPLPYAAFKLSSTSANQLQSTTIKHG
jgi:hypothetical protein